MNHDPHLRRALDAFADRVRIVGEQENVPVMNTIEYLSRHAESGIVGFGEFYDYVHFTPRGVVLVATEIFRRLRDKGILDPAPGFDLESHLKKRLDRLANLEHDPLEVAEWLGIGFDTETISDRDLWKYDRVVADLDSRIELDPSDSDSLIYRANAHYFELDGAAEAKRLYEAALALTSNREPIQANLRRLTSERKL